jgi:hypothetical protein
LPVKGSLKNLLQDGKVWSMFIFEMME